MYNICKQTATTDASGSPPAVTLVTVGHGTLDEQRLGDLLVAAGIATVVDVRRHPGSRRHPHVARSALERWLPERGISYRWEEDLGGRRSRAAGSPNTGLPASLAGYADHLATPACRAALARVVGIAAQATTTVLCAEAAWWRCHRQLLADAAVLEHGVDVVHLAHDGSLEPHRLTAGAHRAGEVIRYGADTLF